MPDERPLKYRKKPVVIEAMRLNDDNLEDVINWIGVGKIGLYGLKDKPFNGVAAQPYTFLRIITLEGLMEAHAGDYIIKGVKGEFYPCKPDIFDQTYEMEYER